MPKHDDAEGFESKSGPVESGPARGEIRSDAGKQAWLAEHAGAVLDAVVDAIVTMDARGNIQSVNTATLKTFGYEPHEIVGQPVAMLMPDVHSIRHQTYVDDYLATGEAKIIGIGRELTAVKKNGDEFPIYLAVSEIASEEGVYFVGIIRDLTEQKAAEDAVLEQKERVAQVGRFSTMGEMTASIAHEINQPLTAIAMYAQAVIRLMQKEEVDTDKILDALKKLNEQSLRAGAVIERIQRFVRHVDGDKAFVDLNALLLEIKNMAAGDARLHGVELEMQLDGALPQVFCDPVQIQQVALNLVRNAIDAMYEIECEHGTTIRIVSESSEDLVKVSVVDCGPGVRSSVAKDLFTPFHSTKKSGMGMGLSISRNIIEDHWGTMSFTNNETHGATFSFTLPVGDGDAHE